MCFLIHDAAEKIVQPNESIRPLGRQTFKRRVSEVFRSFECNELSENGFLNNTIFKQMIL